MKVSGPWLERPETQAVCAMLADAGHRALLVGGCVRNALLDMPVADVDIATDARPERVIALAEAAGLRAVPTGAAHGTVTVIANAIPHEVTTFRRDVQTDGRHATVAFSDDLAEDAARRDFTMNALYAAADGTVIDPLGGLADVVARHVRFVGDPRARIREDYLRILRFFRFHAWYGDAARGFDPEGLAAVAALAEGLDGLSRERVGAEMRRLLAAPDPAPAVAAMAATGVLARVLPGADARALAVLVHLEAGAAPDWLRRLVVLGGESAPEGLRLSRAEARALAALQGVIGSAASAGELGYRLGLARGADAVLARAALLGDPPPPDWRTALEQGAAAQFPLRAADLVDRFQGAALGTQLREAEARWIASGFALSREELLA
ncbi:CCA tRNA nucleotidyltransferase [Plastorhodobacter daqingensis]|uniref:CCA tRNA nucleotidyltransferase n=1 Tax=Plastorhodobacter daqingensis TaxID=1387281 RepID=A0ABW2UDM4_9RHOB